MKKIDRATRKWIRNAADEKAAAAGCVMHEKQGEFVLNFMREHLRLYEGEFAGQPFEPRAWQIEATMRMFGWMKWSERYGRWIRRFRTASVWIPKKNGKSPTLAAWGLYLLIADGEAGQKVFFGAKDGSQAREIAGKHAIEMLTASDSLMAECEINKNEMRITHTPTRSFLNPLSSSDSRSQAAKEGINGCILIDETHVVDRAFINRISRAGISRSEPLQIEVSTAGNDPEGYGKERFDYGERVNLGDEDDLAHLHISYAADQRMDDAVLASNPKKYCKAANPMWGITIDEEEILSDYRRSCRSIQALADFKMYRLNVWQAAANPWLNMAQWAACKREYSSSSLDGQRCYGGLDMAQVRDTSSLVLCFPQDNNTFKLLAYYWLPEDRARELEDKAKFFDWAGDGHVTLTPGKLCDFSRVQSDIAELFSKYDIQKVYYDEKYVNQFRKRLIDEDGISEDRFEVFGQNMMNFTQPTKAFEGLVIDERLHHGGNPILTWQVGNANTKCDNNGNIRPVKQKHGDYRTIDGVVAAIMALHGAMQHEDTGTLTEVLWAS